MKRLTTTLLMVTLSILNVKAQSMLNYTTNVTTVYERYMVGENEEWKEISTLFERNTFDINNGDFFWQRKDSAKYRFQIIYTDEIKSDSSKILKIKDTKGESTLVLLEETHISMSITKEDKDYIFVFTISEKY